MNENLTEKLIADGMKPLDIPPCYTIYNKIEHLKEKAEELKQKNNGAEIAFDVEYGVLFGGVVKHLVFSDVEQAVAYAENLSSGRGGFANVKPIIVKKNV